MKGKLIVLDGTDGSGKGTQTKLLIQRLHKNQIPVATTDFPQYGKKSAGLVEEYLNGKYGSAEDVGPYRASVLFAADRYDASIQMNKWLDEGKIIISNRYVTANMGHQGGKISNIEERKKFFEWLYDLEYNLFQIPKPDLNIILHVDSEIGYKLVEKKEERAYLDGKKRDIHEEDLNHLQQAEKIYFEIAEQFPNFKHINCTIDGKIMTREVINDLIWKEVIKLIN